MTFFTDENLALAEEIIGRYPKPRSAMIPLLHLAQEQEGWVTDEAMAEIAELVGTTSAEVLGTCSFYEMFKRHPVGKYVINICTTMSCALMGAGDLRATMIDSKISDQGFELSSRARLGKCCKLIHHSLSTSLEFVGDG